MSRAHWHHFARPAAGGAARAHSGTPASLSRVTATRHWAGLLLPGPASLSECGSASDFILLLAAPYDSDLGALTLTRKLSLRPGRKFKFVTQCVT